MNKGMYYTLTSAEHFVTLGRNLYYKCRSLPDALPSTATSFEGSFIIFSTSLDTNNSFTYHYKPNGGFEISQLDVLRQFNTTSKP